MPANRAAPDTLTYICTGEDAPLRWPELRHPSLPGFATMEWNILEGLTWFSPEFETMVMGEYDRTTPNNQAWWAERVAPADLAKISRTCLAVHAGFVDGGETTFRIKRGDGVWRTFLTRSRVTRKTPEGAPALAQGICVDISDVLSANPELKLAESLSEVDIMSMLENSPDLFIRFDQRLNPVYVNPAVHRYLGGMHNTPGDTRRLAGNYREVFYTNIKRVFNEKAVVREEMQLAMSDGTAVIGDCSFWPEFDAEGRVRFAMVQFRDTSEQHRMEQRIKLNEQRFRALYQLTLMESASEAEVLQFVMESMLDLFKSPSGFIFLPDGEDGDSGRMLWSVDHYHRYGERYLPHDHLPEDLAIQMTGKDGTRIYRGLNNSTGDEPLYVIFGGKMEVMRGIITSVTENNRLVCLAGVCNKDSDYEEADLLQLETYLNSAWMTLRRRRFVSELQEAKDAAESANKAKNAFLATVSHELRTPLNGVLSMLQLIDSFSMDEEQRGYLYNAAASGKALMRIISDILDYSSMEAGKMRLAIEPFDCRAIVRSTLNVFAQEAAGKSLDFAVHIDDAIPKSLVGDEARLRQVFYNIVGNAIKFTHSGRISVSLRLLDACPPGKAGLCLEVEDTGIGIPEDKLNSIFDAFTRVDNDRRRPYAGTGLGLGITRHLAALMGGTVSIASRMGEGTRCTCTLLFDLPPEDAAAQLLAPDAEYSALGQGLNILVAEDDTVGRVAIRAFLRRTGHKVFCVEDGGQALEALQLYDFDCVFTDISMPNMDGLELVARIRENRTEDFLPSEAMRARVAEFFDTPRKERRDIDPAVCVIAVSAHAMTGDKDSFLSKGMDYYISKPIDKRELDAAIAFVRRSREGE